MTIDLSLILIMGVMYGVGVYLILDRTMTRVLLGLMLLTNATNLLIMQASGPTGLAPLYDKNIPAEEYSDPIPQALVLTSIVISFAVTALVLGMIYRAWSLFLADEILDDTEDQKVATKDSYDREEDALPDIEDTDFEEDEATRAQLHEQMQAKKEGKR
ncbi:Na(+)/H(+) antiporter subunit C [Rothia sp. LK2588]|uniref:Na(+)/H(+) antiporter subunit C n=1 Tax=Rothia sp. LK2588 TaxID=3114369 RepID=UPI0034CD9CCA